MDGPEAVSDIRERRSGLQNGRSASENASPGHPLSFQGATAEKEMFQKAEEARKDASRVQTQIRREMADPIAPARAFTKIAHLASKKKSNNQILPTC